MVTHHMNWDEVHTGHSVCDLNGERIGTVKNVSQAGRAVGGGQPMGGQLLGQGYVLCDCNLPGLTKQLYIPLDAFRDCDGNCCHLNVSKDEITEQGWDLRPGNI